MTIMITKHTVKKLIYGFIFDWYQHCLILTHIRLYIINSWPRWAYREKRYLSTKGELYFYNKLEPHIFGRLKIFMIHCCPSIIASFLTPSSANIYIVWFIPEHGYLYPTKIFSISWQHDLLSNNSLYTKLI